MSEQDKQFVDAVRRWRSADEKDARIAALEAECERLRADLEVMTADRDGCARQRDQQRMQSENKGSK